MPEQSSEELRINALKILARIFARSILYEEMNVNGLSEDGLPLPDLTSTNTNVRRKKSNNNIP